jgi:hypothetical protein
MYKPLTSPSRVEDFEIPQYLNFNGESIELPKSLTNKDVHFLLDSFGKPKRAAWISDALAHMLNTENLYGDVKISELGRALKAIDRELSALIKFRLLTDRQGPGAMGFVQASHNVPKDSILISKRTYETLCKFDKNWEDTRTVMVVRFPNLGPETTKELKLIVNDDTPLSECTSTTLGNRCSNLADLLKLFEEEVTIPVDYLDAFYLNGEVLKNSLQGDGRPTCRFWK